VRSALVNSADGTTFNIIGSRLAAERGARVINMSFAGPADPRLRVRLRASPRRASVAAAGNVPARSRRRSHQPPIRTSSR
jgi:hypothetical protein